MNRIVVTLAVVTAFCSSAASAQQSSRYDALPVTDPEGVRYGDAALADFDQDGDQDLVAIGYAEGDPTPITGREAGPIAGYYRNNGITKIEVTNAEGEAELVDALALTEAEEGRELIGLWQSAVAAHDYDQDGRLDLATLGLDQKETPRLYVYRYVNGANTFELVYSLVGLYAGDLSWGDLDNDGDADLVACGRNQQGEPQTIQYENTGQTVNRFQPSSSTFTGVAECDLEIGDYDTDGDMDVVIAGVTAQDGFATLVYDNAGRGQFARASHEFNSYGWPSVSWGDFDVDGDLDLALTGARMTPSLLEGVVTIYRNESGTFTEEDLLVGAFTNDPVQGRYDGSIGWGDQNNSGYPDLIITGLESHLSTESTQLYENYRGDQLRKSSAEKFDGGVRGAAVWFDHDADLDLDLLVIGDAPRAGAAKVTVMQRKLSFGLSAPSAPANLSASPRNNSVVLSWGDGTDTATPEAGLTYNLRVGTRPQGGDTMTPLSDPSTGRRYVSWRGNVDHNNSWTLHNLSPGIYYWSVQALDQTFASSEFSEEGMFEITGN